MFPSPGIPTSAPRANLAAAREPTTRFLQQLLSELVSGQETRSPNWHEQAKRMLSELLEIDAADVGATSRREPAGNKLDLQERLLHFEDDDIRPRRAGGPARRAARLMALPVLITASREEQRRDLGITGPLDILATSLKYSGMVSSKASVVIARYLYDPDELRALSSSHGFRLAQKMFTQAAPMDNQHAAPVTTTCWADALGKCADASVHSLGFLVLGVVEGAQPEVGQPRAQGDAAQLSAAEIWIRRAGPLLTSALDLQPGASARIVGCAPFHEGLRHGLLAVREIGLRCSILSLLAKSDLSVKAVAAVIAAYADDTGITEVRLSLVGLLTDTLLDGEVFAVRDGDEAEDVAGRIALVLRRVGIDNITHRKYALPLEAKGVKQRIFLTSRKLEHERANSRPELYGIAGALRMH